MKNAFYLIVCWVSLVFASANCFADDSTGYDIILLAGQSNMAGRGKIPSPIDADGVSSDSIKMWDPSLGIVTAKDPINHPEKGYKSTGVGMGMSFAKAYLLRLKEAGYPNRKVLLVGAAWGGTSFIYNDSVLHHRWIATEDPTIGGDLYRGAVKRSNDALAAAVAVEPTSSFKGILWHQGESDLQSHGAPTYADNHTNLMNALRTNIQGAANAPIVVGEMTPCFWAQCESSVRTVSAADLNLMLSYLHNIQNTLPNSAWVSSAGLSGNAAGDQVHFNTQSQRELGRRYFSKFWEAANGIAPPVVDLKSYNGKFFNVGTAIDFDTSYNTATTSIRVNGNVQLNGVVSIVNDINYGNVADIVKSGGKLTLSTDAPLFNGSYTKMAWVKVRSNTYRNHLISAENPSQAHYLYSQVASGYLSAGHSSPTNSVNVYVKEPVKTTLNVWRHVAVTYAASTRTMTLYVDGIAVSSKAAVAPATQATGIVALNISGYGSHPDFGLDGQMISAKVYATPLSANDITNIYQFEKVSQRGYGIQ